MKNLLLLIRLFFMNDKAKDKMIDKYNKKLNMYKKQLDEQIKNAETEEELKNLTAIKKQQEALDEERREWNNKSK